MTNSINGLNNRLDVTEKRFSRSRGEKEEKNGTEAIYAKLLAKSFPRIINDTKLMTYQMTDLKAPVTPCRIYPKKLYLSTLR